MIMRLPVFFRSSLFACLLGTAAALPAFAAGSEGVVTLRDAVAKGVYTHPSYGAMTNNRRATGEELEQAKDRYFPSIDFSADTGREWTRDDATGADPVSAAVWRYQAGITLTQLLFDGFNTSYEIARQKARVESNSYRVWETSEFLGLDVVEAYLNILRQRELLDLAQQNVARHQEIENQIKDSTTAGRTTEADLQQADARLSSARANESSVRESLRSSEATFINKVGGQVPALMERPIAPKSALRETAEEEVKQALLGSPTLASREADIKTAQAEWKQSQSSFYPQVNFEAGVNRSNDISGSEDNINRASGLVTMNWNLYRGGADMSRSREGIYRMAQAKETRADTARAVEEDVRKTWAQMVAASERANEFAAQSAANEKVAAAYFDQFNLDRRTLLDVLDAQNEYFVARSNELNAQYVDLFATYRLLALKGQLLANLNVGKPIGSDPNN